MRIDIPAEHHDRPFEHVAPFAPEIAGAAAMYGASVYLHSKLSLRELEGARYRTAQINGCNTCMGFRGARDIPGVVNIFGGDLSASPGSRGPAPGEDFYANVENWRDWHGFSERERLAIRYAEGIGAHPHAIAEDEDFWKRARAVFTDKEIVDMTYSITAWIAGGRAMHVLGVDTVCSFAPPETTDKAA
jgi:alkylhydroperoxidase family enzyme